MGTPARDRNARDDEPAELVQGRRLHSGDDVVGSSEVPANCTPSRLVIAWTTWATAAVSAEESYGESSKKQAGVGPMMRSSDPQRQRHYRAPPRLMLFRRMDSLRPSGSGSAGPRPRRRSPRPRSGLGRRGRSRHWQPICVGGSIPSRSLLRVAIRFAGCAGGWWRPSLYGPPASRPLELV